jgi:tRNA nucleotidyltransferase/poly(A) polymerase
MHARRKYARLAPGGAACNTRAAAAGGGARAVEDFTGQGLPDLRAGLCRTPLPPLATLTDDPLRALRAVRSASLTPY